MRNERPADPPATWQRRSSFAAEELPREEPPRRAISANTISPNYTHRQAPQQQQSGPQVRPTSAVGPPYYARPANEETKQGDPVEQTHHPRSSGRTSGASGPRLDPFATQTNVSSVHHTQAPGVNGHPYADDEMMGSRYSMERSSRSAPPGGVRAPHETPAPPTPYTSGAPISAVVVKAEDQDDTDGPDGVFAVAGAGGLADSKEEQDKETLKRREEDRRKIKLAAIITCVLLLAIIIGVVVGIVLSGKEPSTPQTPSPIPSTPAPSRNSETETPSAEESPSVDIVDLVSAAIPSLDLTAYQDPESPQGRALAWIESDSFTSDDDRLLQRFTLVTLWYAMGGAKWLEDTNWLSGEGECNDGWYNVTCSISNEAVSLLLFNNNLVGTLPPEVALLTSLTYLELTHPEPGGRLGGAIPTEIGLMTTLEDLYLAYMSFTGTIPTEIGLLTNLGTFWGFQNRFSGATIPTEIGAATSLTDLALFRNNLISTVPTEIVNLSDLESLIIADNLLTGTLPSGMSQLTKLTNINVWGNDLEGAMPDLTGMTALTSLLVFYTDIMGVVPSSLCPNLDDVRVECENFVCTCCFDVDENECPSDLVVSAIGDGGISTAPLSDPLSPQSRALQWLRSDSYSSALSIERKIQRYSLATIFYATGGETTWFSAVSGAFLQPSDECEWTGWVTCSNGNIVDKLDLWLNGLNGTIPEDIGLMTALTFLDWSWNVVTGTIPTTVGLLTELTILQLQDNEMTGPLPTELGLLTKLTILRADENQLGPPIPTELGMLVEINDLQLGVNNMSFATIPTELGLMSNLTTLDLSELGLVGKFPTQLEGLMNLAFINLLENFLTGPLPDLLSWPNIEMLFFHEAGSLTGTIPTTISQLTKLTVLGLGAMDLEGTIPTEAARLTNLRLLSFSGNSFFQPTIPTEFGNLSNLVALFINEAGLVGSIPSELGRLTSLTLLSLNNPPNRLVGTIPVEFEALTDLESMGVRNNNMNGPIPTFIGLWTNLDLFFMSGNDFTGGIPTQIGLLTKLTSVSLGRNENLGGPIPTEIGQLSLLLQVYLSESGHTGQLPTELSTLTQLTWLSLGPNDISGPLPDLSGMTGLEGLFLYDMDLTGTVPSFLCPGFEYAVIDCSEVSCTCCSDDLGNPCL